MRNPFMMIEIIGGLSMVGRESSSLERFGESPCFILKFVWAFQRERKGEKDWDTSKD